MMDDYSIPSSRSDEINIATRNHWGSSFRISNNLSIKEIKEIMIATTYESDIMHA